MDLVKVARELDGFVELDMESHEYTDRTLRIAAECTSLAEGSSRDPGVPLAQRG